MIPGITSGAPVASGGASPYANVVLQLHCEGLNGGTSFVDSSSFARTVTATGSAVTSTAQKKYGAASLALDGNFSCGLSISPLTGIAVGAGDFTIEAWIYIATAVATARALVDQNATGGVTFSLDQFHRLRLLLSGISVVVSGSTAITAGAWHHVAACRSGGTTRLFLDGTQDGSAADANDYSGTSTYFVGGREFARPINGYMDEVRVTKGLALYTGAFTPPGSAFPDA